MRQIKLSKGFSISELSAALSILVIIVTFASSGCLGSGSRVRAREAELKSQINVIRTAIERYKTDQNKYPAYLLGGDAEGWNNWHSRFATVNTINMGTGRVASNVLVRDPLIAMNYLADYPDNVFCDDPRMIIGRTNISGSERPGDGDPRFGYTGKIMGQGLDDMNFFRGGNHPGDYNWSQVETRRTLDKGNWMNIPSGIKNGYPFTTDMYYLFGGMTGPGDDEVIRTWWPGNFFYKAVTDRAIEGDVRLGFPNTNVEGNYVRYILGGYGDLTTDGMDVIRLVYFDSSGDRLDWQCPDRFGSNCFELGYEPFKSGYNTQGGLPEVFGGGSASEGPWTPYGGGTGDPEFFTYGAPDGLFDGVVIVVTDGLGTGYEYEYPEDE